MKKMFIVSLMVLSLVFAGNAFAVTQGPEGWYERTKTNGGIEYQYFSNGHPINNSEWSFVGEKCGACEDAKSDVHPNATINQAVIADGSDGMNGGKAVGDFTVKGDGFATGKDQKIWFWSIPGEAEADGKADPTMSADVKVLTNGKQLNGGLSYSFVKATAEADISGKVSAKGNQGCLQTAYIEADGSIGAFVYGGSYSEGTNGAFAQAGGSGQTTVDFYGWEYDQSYLGLFGNKASVDFDSQIEVNQSLMSFSYVSPDGTKAGNFAYVGGGNAELNLGRDGWFGRDNIDLTGINAWGSVGQYSMATNGFGSSAYGGSAAYFSGANGFVDYEAKRCGPDQTANVGGYALVKGYNQVIQGGSSVTVVSHQYGYATTGNTQMQKIEVRDEF
jgi:hypothetical protein